MGESSWAERSSWTGGLITGEFGIYVGRTTADIRTGKGGNPEYCRMVSVGPSRKQEDTGGDLIWGEGLMVANASQIATETGRTSAKGAKNKYDGPASGN